MLFCFSCLFACFPSLEDEVLLCRPDWPRSPYQASLKLTETHGSASKGLELKSCTTTSAPSFILENFKFLLHFICFLVIYLFGGGLDTYIPQHTWDNKRMTRRSWFSYYFGGPRAWTQVIRLSNRWFCLLSHFTGPITCFWVSLCSPSPTLSFTRTELTDVYRCIQLCLLILSWEEFWFLF